MSKYRSGVRNSGEKKGMSTNALTIDGIYHMDTLAPESGGESIWNDPAMSTQTVYSIRQNKNFGVSGVPGRVPNPGGWESPIAPPKGDD